MIKFSGTNVLVHYVSPVMEIESKSGGQPFYKRELIIDDSWDKDGKRYPNFVSIEFTGDRMNQLDSIFPGQRVNIEGLLSGREYNSRIFNTVRGQLVTVYKQQQQYPSAPAPMPGSYAPQPQYAPQPAHQAAPMPGGYTQQAPYPAYPQTQYAPAPSSTPAPNQAPAPMATPQQQPYRQTSSPGVEDLPWKNQ